MAWEDKAGGRQISPFAYPSAAGQSAEQRPGNCWIQAKRAKIWLFGQTMQRLVSMCVLSLWCFISNSRRLTDLLHQDAATICVSLQPLYSQLHHVKCCLVWFLTACICNELHAARSFSELAVNTLRLCIQVTLPIRGGNQGGVVAVWLVDGEVFTLFEHDKVLLPERELGLGCSVFRENAASTPIWYQHMLGDSRVAAAE